MIKGIGIDIVEIERIKSALEKQSRLFERVLTHEELIVYEKIASDSRKAEWFAGRFAAKEAFSKACGAGIGKVVSFQDIVVTSDERGKPFVTSSKTTGNIHLSISHSEKYAIAQVVIEEI